MTRKPFVLVVDDKRNMVALLVEVLGKIARPIPAGGVREALEVLEQQPVAAVVCDLKMPDGDGLEVLRALQARSPNVPFILMTAHASIGTAVQAMREGAYDYITKPFDPDSVRELVQRALVRGAVIGRAQQTPDDRGPSGLLGRSSGMRELFRIIERVAPTDTTVLIQGEPGTGKELVARALHELSPRKGHQLAAVNCAALPRALLESELFGYVRGAFTGATTDRVGLFEAADKSSLLLDEIGEMRMSVQAKLSRVLEQRAVRRISDSTERPVDVRVFASTHRDLRDMVKKGDFREDLWFRLNVCLIEIAPLRDRPEDIPLLAAHFLAERGPSMGSRARGFTPEALELLSLHTWPGNVRELRSAVERAAVNETGETIRAAALPPELRTPVADRPSAQAYLAEMKLKDAVEASREETNRRYIQHVLRRFGGDVTAAAEHAGVERESFYRLMRRYGIVAGVFRDDGNDA